jgi:hypothetical protein
MVAYDALLLEGGDKFHHPVGILFSTPLTRNNPQTQPG